MKNYFECKVSYYKLDINTNKERKVSESYLVDAVTFTEAEAIMTNQMQKIVSGEFKIVAIKQSRFNEVFNKVHGDRYFKCRITFVDIDSNSGKEKKINNYSLIMADDIDDASERLKEELLSLIVPYEISEIKESNILEVFNFDDK
jgi:hypothetical protein